MKASILLVDDEEGIRKVLGISLSDSGYDVHTAGNGADALKMYRKLRPHIVLTDIKMPDMDGIELLRRIKQEDSDAEVIMFTGQGDMELAIRSLKNDATDFVTKPIDDEILEIAIRKALERIDLRRRLREYTQNLEQLVQEKAEKLIEAERMAAIGQTVAGLSHTIKNIAGSLRGGIFVLEQGIEQDDKTVLREGWEMIQGNVDKIRQLSLDLLNYGKYADLHYQKYDPNLPVLDVVELLAPRFHEKGVALETELAAELSLFYFDPQAVHQSILNLVTNALDACLEDPSNAAGKKVTVRTTSPAQWGVQYCISDNGVGMSGPVREQIFKSFFSTKGTRGTGIGLMMVKKVVERHGGEIELQSESGKGSTFTFRLPLRKQPPSETPQ